jgi:hypothetical protein
MKVLISVAALTVGFIPLQASELLLSKTYNNGPVSPAYQYDVSCEIFDDKVEKLIQVGTASITKSAPVDTKEIKGLIKSAAAGATTTQRGPIGGPSTTYQAILDQAGKPAQIVTLKKEGAQIEKNDSDEAVMLVQLIDQVCN